jgi:hypothetical protein
MLAAGGASTLRKRWATLVDLQAPLLGGATKAAGNPVLAKGTAGQWDDWGVRELDPVIDEYGLTVCEPDGIWAYYWGRPSDVGTMQIGLVKSTDNGLTWSRHSGNPIITPSGSGTGWYGTDILQPAVVKMADGTRIMMAAGRDGDFTTDSVGCLSSADGLVWVDEGQKLLMADFQDGVTAVVEMGVPSLIRRSAGDWLCLVEGLNAGGGGLWRVYGATASDPTGSWTPLNSGEPLLEPSASGWDSAAVANAHVVEAEPGQYLLIYNGKSVAAPDWKVGVAYGSDLTALERYVGNPIIQKGASGQWDDQQTETSFLLKEPSVAGTALRLYYQGFEDSDGSHQIGLATAG